MNDPIPPKPSDDTNPSGESNKPRKPPIPFEHITAMVNVLKGGLMFRPLLSYFEQSFIDQAAAAYSRFGDKTQMSPKQWSILLDIEQKLRLGVQWPEDLVGSDDDIPDNQPKDT